MATNVKDCRYRQLPSHLQNLHLLRYTFLTVKYTKHKAMTRIESEGLANKLTSHDVIGLSLILYSFPISGTFRKGKNSFWTAKIQESVIETYFKTKNSLKQFPAIYSLSC